MAKKEDVSKHQSEPNLMIKKFKPYQTPYRWLVLALYGLSTFLCLIARSIAPLVTPILKDLKISYSQMGMILGSWQLPIFCLRFAGTLIDKWGLRNLILE